MYSMKVASAKEVLAKMYTKHIVTLFLFFQVLGTGSIPTVSQENRLSDNYLKRHEVLLRDTYEVEWTVDFMKAEIEFLVSVKTKGFVGFGISYTGNMKNSDIVIGGIHANGSRYFSDRHGVGETEPVIDPQQDWNLIEASENATHTILKFNRKLDTCDKNDIAITDDTFKIIWCYGNNDNISYHGTKRGILAVNFKDPASEATDLTPFKTWTTAQPLTLPSVDTTYWCTFFKGPQLSKKHHVVGFHIFLNGTNSTRHTHHADLYKCTPPNGENPDEYFGKYLGDGYDCYFSKTNFPVDDCQLFEFQWSVGGKVTMFPDNVGVPVGEGTNEYYMTEIHYDNPQKLSSVEVHSGMEMYYTDQLREHDAGFLQVGVMTSKTYSLTIPPNSKDFVISSHCPSECTSNLPQKGVNAFVYLLHSHLSGRKERVRHFRGTEELPWIANDEHYDFNYQNNRHFRKELKLLPGDQLTLECTYDTNWKNGKATLGGRSARDEMCQTFIMYYPRELKVNQCGSYFSQQQMLEYMGIEKVTNVKGIIDQTILAPEHLNGTLYSVHIEKGINWTSEKREEYQKLIRYGNQQAYCIPFTTNNSFMEITYPNIEKEYTVPNPCLDYKSGTTSSNITNMSLFFKMLGLILVVQYW